MHRQLRKDSAESTCTEATRPSVSSRRTAPVLEPLDPDQAAVAVAGRRRPRDLWRPPQADPTTPPPSDCMPD
jgi:hypothetical protein